VINDLDLFLMPKGSTSTDPLNDAIWYSAQDFMPLEHFFIQIPAAGEYEIWVVQEDDDLLGGGQGYGIAWWAVGVGPTLSGDFDNDNDVDGADFLVWQRAPIGRANLAQRAGLSWRRVPASCPSRLRGCWR